MGRSRTARAVAALALTSCLLSGPGCQPEEATRERPGRVLLIGLDGAAPELTFGWAGEGLLPNIAELQRTGLSGRLRSHKPLLSPRIWTSMATGKTPAKHGIESWVVKEGDGIKLLTGRDRKVHALWNILSEAGLTIGVVNWLNTQPPEEIKGVMVTDFALPGERQGRQQFGAGFARQGAKHRPDVSIDEAGKIVTYPPGWIATLSAMVEEEEPLTEFANPFVDNEPLPLKFFTPMLARTFRNDNLVARIALEIERREHPDVMMVYFPGIDRTCHMFWGGIASDESYPDDVRFPTEGKRSAAEAVKTYYRYADALVGRLLASYGPNDLILVVSDHGFEAVHTRGTVLTGGHDSDAAVDGIILARGAGIAAGGTAHGVSVDDITPTILAWLGLPVAKDMDGRVAPFLKGVRVAQVDTYEGGEIVRLGTHSEVTEKGIIEDLRALGYVE